MTTDTICFTLQVKCSFVLTFYINIKPIRVAARSKAWVCGGSLSGIAGSNPSGGMDVCLLWGLCVVR